MTLKRTIIVGTLCGFATLSQISWADCAHKEANLLRQLEYAKKYNNQERIRGLEIALNKTRRYCNDGRTHHYETDQSDTDLKEPTATSLSGQKGRIESLQKRVFEQKRDLIDAEYELEKARLSGKAESIAKKELKLKKEKAILELYETELAELLKKN